MTLCMQPCNRAAKLVANSPVVDYELNIILVVTLLFHAIWQSYIIIILLILSSESESSQPSESSNLCNGHPIHKPETYTPYQTRFIGTSELRIPNPNREQTNCKSGNYDVNRSQQLFGNKPNECIFLSKRPNIEPKFGHIDLCSRHWGPMSNIKWAQAAFRTSRGTKLQLSPQQTYGNMVMHTCCPRIGHADRMVQP